MQNRRRMQGISGKSLLMPVVVAIVAAGAAIALWRTLSADHESGVANVAEATSYATRSELARRLIIQFQSLHTLADIWVSSANDTELPVGAETPLEIIRFEGIDVIAWSDSDGTRYLASGAKPVLGYVPLPGEWAPIATLVAEAYAATTETTHGPFIEPDGHAIFHHYLPVTRGMRRGALVAIIDANDLLEALLIDEAPGYEIRVTCCDGIELYRRGTADAALPTPWREGRISPARGILWSVAHRPSPMLADDLENVAVDLVLIAGLALALVLGGLVFQTQRAAERAAAASAAEQRVRKLNRELEDRVVTRTKKLNDALTDFNTINLSVAHDLRSPLNAVSLLAGQVRQGNQHDTVAAGRCDKITANVERMAGITDRLLGYSRASSFDSQLEDVDMRAMAEQVVREQSIAPETVSIGALPHARADGLIIHILLSNLVGNAAKHGQSDQGPRIEIGSRAIADGGIAYFVRDDGPGIEKELADRLFKPMTERRKNGEGLGLGLAISARAVERHHGRIWVESEPGNGATFLFTLNDANVDSGQERH